MRRVPTADLARMGLVALLSSTPVAFMTFDFFLPNMSTPSFAKNLLAIFLMSVLVGLPSGFFIERLSLGMVSVIAYTALGYVVAVLYYTVPALLYEVTIVIPGLYYAAFFYWTVLLLFFFVFGGFVGAVMGSTVHQMIKKEETLLTFSEAPAEKE